MFPFSQGTAQEGFPRGWDREEIYYLLDTSECPEPDIVNHSQGLARSSEHVASQRGSGDLQRQLRQQVAIVRVNQSV
jgi:hypothetical protein